MTKRRKQQLADMLAKMWYGDRGRSMVRNLIHIWRYGDGSTRNWHQFSGRTISELIRDRDAKLERRRRMDMYL